MNERIRQFAEISIKESGQEFWWLTNDLVIEKFAQLIVAECINKITTYDLVPGHSAKWEDIYDIHARLLQDLGQELKEHFGVE
jgi:hypothetical protein